MAWDGIGQNMSKLALWVVSTKDMVDGSSTLPKYGILLWHPQRSWMGGRSFLPSFRTLLQARSKDENNRGQEGKKGIIARPRGICRKCVQFIVGSSTGIIFHYLVFFERVVYPTDVLHSWHHLERLER